jgi:hypothetical protein
MVGMPLVGYSSSGISSLKQSKQASKVEKTQKQWKNKYTHNYDEDKHNRCQESIAKEAGPVGEQTGSACNSRNYVENESTNGEEREPGTETAIDGEHSNDYKGWRDQPYYEADKILKDSESAFLSGWRLSTHLLISLLASNFTVTIAVRMSIDLERS